MKKLNKLALTLCACAVSLTLASCGGGGGGGEVYDNSGNNGGNTGDSYEGGYAPSSIEYKNLTVYMTDQSTASWKFRQSGYVAFDAGYTYGDYNIDGDGSYYYTRTGVNSGRIVCTTKSSSGVTVTGTLNLTFRSSSSVTGTYIESLVYSDGTKYEASYTISFGSISSSN